MKISNSQIDEVLRSLLALHPKRIDLSLDRITTLLSKINNPQENISNGINVVGSNGKFSSLKYIQEIIRYNNKTTNSYISPHLQRFNERIELKDKQITNEKLFDALNYIKEKNNNDLCTFFEITTATFFDLASKHDADYTLIECGLGGRLDATSKIPNPIMTVISSISYDHQEFLGNTIEKIAFEKSCIMKKHVPVIIGYQPYKEAKQILIDQAQYRECPTFIYGDNFFVSDDKDQLIYEDTDNRIKFNKLKSHNGKFQIKNLATAIATCLQLYKIDVKDFLKNNMHQNVYFPGRFEKLENHKLNKLISDQNELYLDGSHNQDGSKNINEALKELPNKELCLVVGMINSKDPLGYISEYENIEMITTVTIPDEDNSFSADELKNIFSKKFKNVEQSSSTEEAVKLSADKFPSSRILICGSLYYAGKILNMSNQPSGQSSQ